MLERIQKEWSEIAGGSTTMTFEIIKGTVYAFGSELECLRLAYAFRRSGDRAKFGFSENLATFYFRLEPMTAETTKEPMHYALHRCGYGRQFLRLSTVIVADVDCPECLKEIESSPR